MLSIGSEPLAIIAISDACLNTIQAAAIPMPTPVHWGIAVVLVILGTILARSQVTPNGKVHALLAKFLPAGTASGSAAAKS